MDFLKIEKITDINNSYENIVLDGSNYEIKISFGYYIFDDSEENKYEGLQSVAELIYKESPDKEVVVDKRFSAIYDEFDDDESVLDSQNDLIDNLVKENLSNISKRCETAKAFEIKAAMVKILKNSFPYVDFSVEVDPSTFRPTVRWYNRHVSGEAVARQFIRYGDISKNLILCHLLSINDAERRKNIINEALGTELVDYRKVEFYSDTGNPKEKQFAARFVNSSEFYEISEIIDFLNGN